MLRLKTSRKTSQQKMKYLTFKRQTGYLTLVAPLRKCHNINVMLLVNNVRISWQYVDIDFIKRRNQHPSRSLSIYQSFLLIDVADLTHLKRQFIPRYLYRCAISSVTPKGLLHNLRLKRLLPVRKQAINHHFIISTHFNAQHSSGQ